MDNSEVTKRISEIMMFPLAAKSLNVLSELGIADHLLSHSLAIDELARRCEVDATILMNTLKVANVFGFFSIADNGLIGNNDSSLLLTSTNPDSMRHFCQLFGDEYYQAYQGMLNTCQTSESGFKHIYQQTLYQYLEQNPPRSLVYNLAMRDFSRPVGLALSKTCADIFEQAHSVLDIGGGSGVIASQLVKAFPHLSASVLDRADVCEQCTPYLDACDNIDMIPGDFFQFIPSGYDVLVLKNVLHNWNNESCQRILKLIHASLGEGKLLVIEPLVESEETSPRLVFNALFQSVICEDGTYQRSDADMRALLAQCGLSLVSCAKLPTGHTVLEAIKSNH